ncbi:MAG TPA: hypothetical protein VIL86_10035 [Tepidisphaeraceae bacterium]
MSGARIREVLDSDLDALANGSAESSTALAFAMGCLPLAVGLFFAFLTLDQPNPKLVAGYIAIISVTAILGLFFFVIWFRTRRRAKDLLERIREMSPFVELQGVEETTTPDAPPSPPNASENQP